MDVTVKTEDGQGESITEVGNASVRDGDVGSGSLKDRGKKTVSPSDGETKTETKTDWNEEDFVLTIDYFAIECNLPNDGQLPGDIPKSLVSDEEFERCFGPSTGFKGRNGPNIKNCVGLPQSEMLHLFQVIDGHDKPVNGTMGKMFPRALYAERFLKKRINWAAYAFDRHRNQIRSHKQRGEEKPSGPPIVRPHRVYKPPPNLILELASYDEPAISKEPKISKEVKPKVQPAATNIRDREKLIAKLQDIITAQSDAIDSIRDKLKIVAESISNAESQFKTDNAERAKLETERSTLAARKQTLEMRLEDGGFNEDDPEAGVERTWRVSTTATKVRGASPCSTILSSREDDRDNDASLVATNHVPVTRSKKGKRGGSKADIPARKVRTRSQITEAEMSTGITPCPYTKVVLRPLGEIETPEALKGTGDVSSCKKSKRKILT
ncbi:hypothetical protein R1sor_014972 [Riccia sorocarpa]|uniref:Uncharacterized protein n=1 Tax=Riccia sorocarpa TaxID=122646 RepID=A0ABD3HB78_9MARC